MVITENDAMGWFLNVSHWKWQNFVTPICDIQKLSTKHFFLMDTDQNVKTLLECASSWDDLKDGLLKIKDFQLIDPAKYYSIDIIIQIGDGAFSRKNDTRSNINKRIGKWLQEKDNLFQVSNFFDWKDHETFFSHVFNRLRSQGITSASQFESSFKAFVSCLEDQNSNGIFSDLNSFTLCYNSFKSSNTLSTPGIHDEQEMKIHFKKLDDFLVGYKQYVDIKLQAEQLSSKALQYFCSEAYYEYNKAQTA